jgi:ubiquinone/menaquinone biosynthesis C-methylase UbiE
MPSHDAASDAKRRMAALYSRVAPSYAEHGPPHFAYAGRRLVEVTRVSPGDRVLDIGTGRGAVLLPAAERVGPTGQALGIDLADGMLEQTAKTLAERHLDWAQVRHMDADHLDLPDESFTSVLCSFAVFFFANVPNVVASIRRVLMPGGSVGFAFERDVDARWTWYEDLLRDRGALSQLAPMPGSGSAIRKRGALEACLESAGFHQANELVEEVDLTFSDAETWWASLWTHGSRRALEALPPDQLDDIKEICLERARSLAGPTGLVERHQFVFVTAQQPEMIGRVVPT